MNIFNWTDNHAEDKYSKSYKLEFGPYIAYVDYDLQSGGWKFWKTYPDSYMVNIFSSGPSIVNFYREKGFGTLDIAKEAVEKQIIKWCKEIVQAAAL